MRGRAIEIRRPKPAVEALRVPCGSWWLDAKADGFTKLVEAEHQQRMRARGISSFSDNPQGPPQGRKGIGI